MDGELIVDGERYAGSIPVPLEVARPVELRLMFDSIHTVSVKGGGVRLELVGEPRYVEEFRHRNSAGSLPFFPVAEFFFRCRPMRRMVKQHPSSLSSTPPFPLPAMNFLPISPSIIMPMKNIFASFASAVALLFIIPVRASRRRSPPRRFGPAGVPRRSDTRAG